MSTLWTSPESQVDAWCPILSAPENLYASRKSAEAIATASAMIPPLRRVVSVTNNNIPIRSSVMVRWWTLDLGSGWVSDVALALARSEIFYHRRGGWGLPDGDYLTSVSISQWWWLRWWRRDAAAWTKVDAVFERFMTLARAQQL